MRAVQLKGGCHYCDECEKYYPGSPEAYEVLENNEESGTRLENVETVINYGCRDPRGACELQADQITFYDEAFMCGDCEEVYPNIGEAMSCCS